MAYTTLKTGSSTSVIYEPQPSDLAYLLHDPDEEVYDDTIPTPPTPIPVKYIVEKLEEYGTKCIPLKVYVSALLRTWETALLVYLPFLYNKTQPKYSQTLILEVSPFLLEKRSKFDATTLNSDLPRDFAGNVNQFFNFIKLFIFFKKSNTSTSIKLFKDIAEESLNQIPDNFTIILVAGNDKVYLRVFDSERIEYHLPSNIPATTLNTQSISIPDITIQGINNVIVDKIDPPPVDSKYESYNDNRLTTNPTIPPRTIYSTFKLWGGSINFNNFETIAKFQSDIFSFLKWVIEFKSHPKNTPILFVSHSKTMNEFLKMLICNLNYNYSAADAASFPPTKNFVEVCTAARKTNTWSMRFKYLGYNVTGFRHAQSCDNMYKTLDEATGKAGKIIKYGSYVATLGVAKGKELSDRNKVGNYTNLSLWGIFSTLIFIQSNKGIISNFKNSEIDKSGLMVLSGMGQQSKENIKEFGVENELTCGDVSSRFLVSSAGAGAGAAASSPNYKQIENLVDIIPPSIPFQKMDITTRQQMSNELYSLDSIFKIEFMNCDKSGCKIKVTYIGPYNFAGFIPGDSFNTLTSEDKERINALAQRKVYITINKTRSDYVLTLQNVYKGGYAIGDNGTQAIRAKDAQTLLPEKNIEISSDFQKSVGFLMGFDLIKESVITTYDIPYNTIILYSNLLIRQLLTTHLLVTSYQNKSNLTLFNSSRDDTKIFLEKGTAELYGGKNNKKSKHKQNKNK